MTEQHARQQSGYPSEQAVDVMLRDGSTIHVRPVRADDREAIRRFLSGLSEDSLYMRGCGIPNLERLSDWSADVDYADRYGVLATHGDRTVGHGAYVRAGPHSAEVAFEVADSMHGLGIATILLGHLAAVAARHGITEFTAEVMPSNNRMIAAFQSSGFPLEQRFAGGLTEVRMPTALSAQTRAAFERRAHTAARAALRHILEPGSVAVIGASQRRGAIGTAVMRNLIASGFDGHLYPVNPRHRSVHGRAAYRSVSDLPGPVDLALVAVPAPLVPRVAQEAADAGVHAIAVLSSGFADGGGDGRRLQRELLDICRDGGVRLVGPGSLGVLNQTAHMNATVARAVPTPGPVGLMAQSGGVGAALLELARARSLGISEFVSVGDKADISGNDLLEFWEDDPDTKVIALYLESFGNPRRFARIARHVAMRKPVLVVKSGAAAAGSGSSGSRIRSLAAMVTVDALFQQAGVIRAGTIGELLDTAALLAAQPPPAGLRVAVLSNGHGAAQLAVDACRAEGMAVPELSAATQARLRPLLADSAVTANPVDLTRSAPAAGYRGAIELIAGSGECDAILAIVAPAQAAGGRRMAAAIDAAARRAGEVTVAAVLMDAGAGGRARAAGAARFSFPEEAARSLAAAARWSLWRAGAQPAQGGGDDDLSGCDSDGAREIIVRAVTGGLGRLPDDQAAALLGCYGIRPPAGPAVATPDAAAAASAAACGAGCRDCGRLTVGVTHDANFGPVLVCAPADPRLPYPGSVSARLTPLTAADAHVMARARLPSLPDPEQLLSREPHRGLHELGDLLLRIGALADAHPQLAELELTAIVSGDAQRPLLLDGIEIRVQAAPAERPLGWLRR